MILVVFFKLFEALRKNAHEYLCVVACNFFGIKLLVFIKF